MSEERLKVMTNDARYAVNSTRHRPPRLSPGSDRRSHKRHSPGHRRAVFRASSAQFEPISPLSPLHLGEARVSMALLTRGVIIRARKTYPANLSMRTFMSCRNAGVACKQKGVSLSLPCNLTDTRLRQIRHSVGDVGFLIAS